MRSNREIIIRVGPCYLKVDFRSDEGYISRLIKEVLLQYKENIVPNHRGKIDLTIYINRLACTKSFVTYTKKSKSSSQNYLLIYEQHGNNIYTINHISILQLNYIINNAFLYCLLRNKSIILHASSIIINNQAHIFTGSSGAGKSTLAKMLSVKYQIFTDDRIIITEEKNRLMAHQTNFQEKETYQKNFALSYPVRKIYFLRQSTSCLIQKITDKEVISKRILSQLISDRQSLNFQYKKLTGVINKFSDFYYLYFPKDNKQVLDLFMENK